MSDKIYTIDEIRRIVQPIAKNFGVEHVYLFGSYARGEADRSSDIDLRIDNGNVKGLFALAGLINSFSDALGKDVDVITTSGLDAEFLNRIGQEEVLLYA